MKFGKPVDGHEILVEGVRSAAGEMEAPEKNKS